MNETNFRRVLVICGIFLIFLSACNNSSEKCEGACLTDFSYKKECQNILASGIERMSDTGAYVSVASEGLKITLSHKNAYLNCTIALGTGKILGLIDFDKTTNTIKLTEEEKLEVVAGCMCTYEVDFTVEVFEYNEYKVEIWSKNKIIWANRITVDDSGSKVSDSDEPPAEMEIWD